MPAMYHAGLYLPINQPVLMNKASSALVMLTFQRRRQPTNKQIDSYDMVLSAMKNHKQG